MNKKRKYKKKANIIEIKDDENTGNNFNTEVIDDVPSINNSKRKKILTIIIGILLLILFIIFVIFYLILPIKTPSITYAEELNEDDSQTIKFKINKYNNLPIYCSIDNKNFIEEKNGECTFNLTSGEYELFLKNKTKIAKTNFIVDINKVKSIKLNVEKWHLALGETFTLTTKIEKIGSPDETITFESSDPEIASVDENGIVTGIKDGTVTITASSIDGVSTSANIIVTSLIVKPVFNLDKKKVPCNRYTQEEADLLDEILFERVAYAGDGTRGAVLASARFLALSFEYKVPYFFENGRLKNTGKQAHIDGEGRYYHKGLYLHKSKFSGLEKGAKMAGPSIWGCGLTNYDTSYGWCNGCKYPNGLDCSGFVTWALYNGGIDVGDVGSGISKGIKDLSDYGVMHELTYDFANNGNYKVGDYIARDGHAALLAGKDDKYLYIAESLLYGVRIVKYSYKDKNSKLYKLYGFINTMDDVYSGDGIYTDMW